MGIKVNLQIFKRRVVGLVLINISSSNISFDYSPNHIYIISFKYFSKIIALITEIKPKYAKVIWEDTSM